jgi:hypothetical protein
VTGCSRCAAYYLQVILDTIAARCGDVLAAGMYSVLVEKLHAGLVAM